MLPPGDQPADGDTLPPRRRCASSAVAVSLVVAFVCAVVNAARPGAAAALAPGWVTERLPAGVMDMLLQPPLPAPGSKAVWRQRGIDAEVDMGGGGGGGGGDYDDEEAGGGGGGAEEEPLGEDDYAEEANEGAVAGGGDDDEAPSGGTGGDHPPTADEDEDADEDAGGGASGGNSTYAPTVSATTASLLPSPRRTRRLSSTRSPHPRPSHTPSVTPRPAAPPRYLLILSCPEGMSGWLRSVQEAADLARALGRALVMPCARGGLLMPCAPGRVLPVPAEDDATAQALAADPAADSRAFPAFVEDCARKGARADGVGRLPITGAAFRAFPLNAYLSAAGVRELLGDVPVVSFDAWAAERAAAGALWPGGRPGQDDGTVHTASPVIQLKEGCRRDRRPVTVGAYVFRAGRRCLPWKAGVAGGRDAARGGSQLDASQLSSPAWAKEVDVFTSSWYRGDVDHVLPIPELHPAHAAAVRAWVMGLPGGAWTPAGSSDAPVPAYAAMQWRTETLGQPGFRSYPTCAESVLASIASTQAALAHVGAAVGAPHAPPLVLSVDMPAPGNPCVPSRYHAPEQSDARVAGLLARGVRKYDADWAAGGRWPLDAGVVALREVALSVGAGRFAACDTRHAGGASSVCLQCSWRSEFVRRIILARDAAGRTSVRSMLDPPDPPVRAQDIYAAAPRANASAVPASHGGHDPHDPLPCPHPPCVPLPRYNLRASRLCPHHAQLPRVGLVLAVTPRRGGSSAGEVAHDTVAVYTLARALGVGYAHAAPDASTDLVSRDAAHAATEKARIGALLALPSFDALGCDADAGAADGCRHEVVSQPSWDTLAQLAREACTTPRSRVVLHLASPHLITSSRPGLAAPRPGSFRPYLHWLRSPCGAQPGARCAAVRVALHVRGGPRDAREWPPMAYYASVATAAASAVARLGFPVTVEVFANDPGKEPHSDPDPDAVSRETIDAVFAHVAAAAASRSGDVQASVTVRVRHGAGHSVTLTALGSAHVLIAGPTAMAHAALLLHEPGMGVVLAVPHDVRTIGKPGPPMRSDAVAGPGARWLVLPRAAHGKLRAPPQGGERDSAHWSAGTEDSGWEERVERFVVARRRSLPYAVGGG